MADLPKYMIFIDASNTFRSMRRYGESIGDEKYNIDYFKLIEVFSKDKNLIRAYLYASTKAKPQVRLPVDKDIRAYTKEELKLAAGLRNLLQWTKQQDLYDILKNKGVKVTIKPLKHDKEKGVDVALVTDFIILGLRKTYDIATIVSGDEDYINAIEIVQSYGAIVEVAAFKNALSPELVKHVDRVVILDDIAKKISMK